MGRWVLKRERVLHPSRRDLTLLSTCPDQQRQQSTPCDEDLAQLSFQQMFPNTHGQATQQVSKQASKQQRLYHDDIYLQHFLSDRAMDQRARFFFFFLVCFFICLSEFLRTAGLTLLPYYYYYYLSV